MDLPLISIKISKSYVAMFEANCLELAFIHKAIHKGDIQGCRDSSVVKDIS